MMIKILNQTDDQMNINSEGLEYMKNDVQVTKESFNANVEQEPYLVENSNFGDSITANDYQTAALRTARYDLTIDISGKDALLLNGLMGLNGEAGEALDILKKHLCQGHELDKEHIKKELGDVSWYLAVAAYALDTNLSDIFEGNVKKLEARYPDGFDAEHSMHRVEGDI